MQVTVIPGRLGSTVPRVRLSDGTVRTVAGGAGTRSPWGVAWWRGRVWIAMAGVHQLWTLDPLSGDLAVVAGTGREEQVDGPVRDALFAQTSALAVDPGRDGLWLVDAESSALRVVENSPGGLVVRTVIGRGLFAWSHRDGPAPQALLQHPLGVRLDSDDAVLVGDTYDGAVRRYGPVTDSVLTLATGLAEPSDLLPASTGGDLLVVESADPALTVVERLPREMTAPGAPAGKAHPACHLHRQEWEVPVVLDRNGAGELSLRLGAAPDRQHD